MGSVAALIILIESINLTSDMPRREVERWDPPNRTMPKHPIPLWGATSTYIRANEAVGPIFPVQRENTFAVTAPPEKPPALETNCSYPVIPIQTRNTVYSGDQITDWGGMPPLLVGPKYIDTDGKNGFVPPKPVAEKPPPTINFPIVTLGVTAQNKFLSTLASGGEAAADHQLPHCHTGRHGPEQVSVHP